MHSIAISISSPIGPLLLEHDGDALTSLRFLRAGERLRTGTRDAAARTDGIGRAAVEQLDAYFSGGRSGFYLPLRMVGTDFQRRVWAALARVPFGQTRTYAELAQEVGSVGAARAVGQANARNPIPIIVPCHRVVASGGGIGGYAGDWGEGEGVARKRWLLTHEGGCGTAESCGAAALQVGR